MTAVIRYVVGSRNPLTHLFDVQMTIEQPAALQHVSLPAWIPGSYMIREFAKHLQDELDLMREASNASQLRRNFADSPLLAVPEIHWDYCTPTVMTMQRMQGTPVSQVETLRAQVVDIAELARAAPPGKVAHATGASLSFAYGGAVVVPPLFALVQMLSGSYLVPFIMAALFAAAGVLSLMRLHKSKTIK